MLKLLDGSTRTLVAEDLVVADEVKALGLAGVMGGWDTMITAGTKNILVEAAWFDPASIRASSRRHPDPHGCVAPVRAWCGFQRCARRECAGDEVHRGRVWRPYRRRAGGCGRAFG